MHKQAHTGTNKRTHTHTQTRLRRYDLPLKGIESLQEVHLHPHKKTHGTQERDNTHTHTQVAPGALQAKPAKKFHTMLRKIHQLYQIAVCDSPSPLPTTPLNPHNTHTHSTPVQHWVMARDYYFKDGEEGKAMASMVRSIAHTKRQ